MSSGQRRGGPLVRHPGRAALVGTLAILAVSALAFHPSLVQSSRFRLTGVFAASQGLTKGAPVRVAGYDVGRVVGLERGPGSTALVRMELDDHAPPLFAGTTMRVRPRVFLEGGFYVDVNPGIPAGGPRLHSGATIPLPQTAIAVQSDQPLSRMDSAARANVATILHELATALDHGGARDIRGLTREAPDLLRSTAVAAQASRGRRAGQLADLVQQAAAAYAGLQPAARELTALVTDSDRTFRALGDHGHDLATAIRLADQTLRQTPATLRVVDAALPELDRYTAISLPVLDRLPRALRSTAELLAQGNRVSRATALPRLLRTLTPTIRRLPRLLQRQIPLFGHVEPVSTCFADKVTPVLDAKLEDGALSTGRPAWLDFLHGMVNAAGATQNFDGNGAYLRYEGGLADQTVSTGSVPGAGTLVGLSSAPLLGVRPVWNGPTPPPFDPGADCRTQRVPSLRATAATPPAGRRLGAAQLDTPRIRRLAARLERERRR